MDIGFDGTTCYLFEFQFLDFGPLTLERSDYHFARNADGWVKVERRSVLEEEFTRSVVSYIKGRPKA